MRKLFLLLTLTFFSLSANISANADETYIFDLNHTNITWSANHYGFSSPSGKFSKTEGTLILDKTNHDKSSAKITVQTASIFTGIEKFDKHLKSDSFLNVEKFPTATFISTKVISQGKKGKVYGNLTLLGVTKPIIFNVKLNKRGINPFTQKKTIGFSAKTTIKRSEFGMTFALPGISDKVNIRIEAEAFSVKKPSKDLKKKLTK